MRDGLSLRGPWSGRRGLVQDPLPIANVVSRRSALMNPRYVLLTAGSLVAGAVLLNAGNPPVPQGQPDAFEVAVHATGLDTPWDLAWGPDGMIWVSERGGRISRVDPVNGRRTTAGEVRGVAESGEGGLMGIAMHPDFAREPWVYAAHTYTTVGRTRNRVVRMRWTNHSLGEPQVLIDDIPGAGVHNGARLAVGPDRHLYITTGDAGNANAAQDSMSLAGKILRLTLDGRIPADNPFSSAVWSWGHRNGQGLVFHSGNGRLIETEHGPGDNDEINIIERGRNYGWPDVRGLCDEPQEAEACRARRFVPAVAAWSPTLAIAGADVYPGNRIPAFAGSLLAVSLKESTLWRIVFNRDWTEVARRERFLAGRYGRLRDVLVAPNGDVFIATSNRDGRGSPRDNDDRILRITPR